MNPESEYDRLRDALDELRRQMTDRQLDHTRDIGYCQGWQKQMEVRFDHLERRLDNLISILLQQRHRANGTGKALADMDSGPEGI